MKTTETVRSGMHTGCLPLNPRGPRLAPLEVYSPVHAEDGKQTSLLDRLKQSGSGTRMAGALAATLTAVAPAAVLADPAVASGANPALVVVGISMIPVLALLLCVSPVLFGGKDGPT